MTLVGGKVELLVEYQVVKTVGSSESKWVEKMEHF